MTTLCLDECPAECGGCRGTIRRSCAAVSAAQHWLVLVSDDAEALAGEIGLHDDALAVRSRQQLQVDLASWYIRHSMALTAVLNDLSRRPDQVLAPETRVLLQSVDPHNRQGGWLDHLHVLVRLTHHKSLTRPLPPYSAASHVAPPAATPINVSETRPAPRDVALGKHCSRCAFSYYW